MPRDDVYPFSRRGITRDARGVARFSGLAATVPHLLRRAVDAAPEREAVADPARRLAYHHLWDRAARIAGGLRGAGCAAGDRVALCMPNCVTWVEAYFGILLAGCVVVPVNARLVEPEIDFIVSDCDARLVLRRPSDSPPVRPCGKRRRIPRRSPRSATRAGRPGGPRVPC